MLPGTLSPLRMQYQTSLSLIGTGELRNGYPLTLFTDQKFSEAVDFSTSKGDLGPAKFKVDEMRGRVGYINGEVLYGQEPQTAYQKWCRETAKPPMDLQHFTQSFNGDTVRR